MLSSGMPWVQFLNIPCTDSTQHQCSSSLNQGSRHVTWSCNRGHACSCRNLDLLPSRKGEQHEAGRLARWIVPLGPHVTSMPWLEADPEVSA